MTPPPTASPTPIIATTTTTGPIIELIIARLAALNPTDPQLQALLAQYQAATGHAIGT